jgi:hypothetical protein
MTILASDNFNRANGGLGANWTTTTSEVAPSIISNECDFSANDTGARYTAISWPNDQYAQVTIGSVVSPVVGEGVGVACRIASAAKTHYLIQGNTNETRLYKVVSGAFTQLGSDGVAVAAADVLRLICNGSSISVTKNGSIIIGPVTDTEITAGDAGLWGSNNEATHPTADNFEGGDFAAGVFIPIIGRGPGMALAGRGGLVA